MPGKAWTLAIGTLLGTLTGSAQADDLVNGLPCSQLCKSWLAVDGADDEAIPASAPKTAEVAAPLDVLPTPEPIQRRTRMRSRLVNFYYSLRPDCSSRGPITVLITQPAKGGDVTAGQGRMHPVFPASDAMSTCNRKRVEVTRLYYEPTEESVPEDDFAVRAVFPDGTSTEEHFHIAE